MFSCWRLTIDNELKCNRYVQTRIDDNNESKTTISNSFCYFISFSEFVLNMKRCIKCTSGTSTSVRFSNIIWSNKIFICSSHIFPPMTSGKMRKKSLCIFDLSFIFPSLFESILSTNNSWIEQVSAVATQWIMWNYSSVENTHTDAHVRTCWIIILMLHSIRSIRFLFEFRFSIFGIVTIARTQKINSCWLLCLEKCSKSVRFIRFDISHSARSFVHTIERLNDFDRHHQITRVNRFYFGSLSFLF